MSRTIASGANGGTRTLTVSSNVRLNRPKFTSKMASSSWGGVASSSKRETLIDSFPSIPINPMPFMSNIAPVEIFKKVLPSSVARPRFRWISNKSANPNLRIIINPLLLCVSV